MRVVGWSKGSSMAFDAEPIDRFGHLMEIEAARAFKRMHMEAKRAGIELHVNYAWRSMVEQRRIYNNYGIRMRGWELTPENKRGPKPLRPARPGYSNHQSGIAVDINRAHDDPDGPGPLVGATDAWLAENAGRFGFMRPLELEPWHWEYRPKLCPDYEKPAA